MNNHVLAGSPSLLSTEIVNRMTQLGMSRRALTNKAGISRQTLHNIEHGQRTELKPATYSALDTALLWRPGTALALASGDADALDDADENIMAEKAGAYRWRIVESIQRMSLDELERLVSIMERESFGTTEPLTGDSAMALVAQRVAELEKKIGILGDEQSKKSIIATGKP